MIKQRIGFTNYTDFNGCLYFYERNGIGICKYDKNSKSVEVIWRDNNPVFYKYSDVIFYNDMLFFAPYQSEAILIYHINDSSVEEIPIDEKGLSIKIIPFDDKLIFIRQSDNYYELDLKTSIIEKIHLGDGINCTSHSDVCCVDGKLYLPTNIQGGVLEINPATKCCSLFSLSVQFHFNTIAYADNKFLMSGNKKCLIVWDKNKNTVNTIDVSDDIMLRNEINWNGLFSTSKGLDNKVFLSPLAADSFILVDINTKQIDIITKVPNYVMSWCLTDWDKDKFFISFENTSGNTQKDYIINSLGQIISEDIMSIENESYSNIRNETIWDGLKGFIENL
jgi:hypothetical protein